MAENNENIIYDDTNFPYGEALECLKYDVSEHLHDGEKKYECKECGHEFWGEDADEEDGIRVCPECGSASLEETSPSDDELYDEWNDQNQINFEDDIRYGLFENVKKRVVVRGSVGRWNGTSSGMSIEDDFESAFYSILKDCDYTKVYENEFGDMNIYGIHHDGTAHGIVRVLTPEAADFMDEHEFDKDMSMHDFIEGTWNLCRPMDYCHEEWGCESKIGAA